MTIPSSAHNSSDVQYHRRLLSASEAIALVVMVAAGARTEGLVHRLAESMPRLHPFAPQLPAHLAFRSSKEHLQSVETDNEPALMRPCN
jgi:hypothetical protein